MRATRVIIHLDTFAANFSQIRGRIGPKRHICAAVKADAYGHGAAAIARASLAAGAAYLAVADLQEGAELRKEGIEAPILVFSQPLPSEIPEIAENRLIPLVSGGEFIALLAQAASAARIRLPVHLKIDTGMGRMGCRPDEAVPLARQIAACPSLAYEGTATHLAASDSAAPEDIAYTEQQIACFAHALETIQAAGLNPGIAHAANSGGIIMHPKAWFDMVRPGILLYGYGAKKDSAELHVEPVMELRTQVVFMKKLKKGETVSYNRTWAADRDTVIGVLPAGYADGLPRLASNRWQAVINGKTYPLAGNICMDQCMADLGPAPPVSLWDEATLFGGPAPGAGTLAERIGTIPYEIICGINKRVPRVYEA